MKIFDEVFGGVERAMDVRFKRHVVLTSNAANSETPNYRARELDFAGTLEKAFGNDTAADLEMAKTNPLHMDVGSSEGDHVVLDNSGAMGADGNNVDIDLTMGKISDNGRAYEAAAGMLNQKFRLLRTFIRRGGV